MAVGCARPGCTGTIEDGYCNVCGNAVKPSSATPGSPVSWPAPGAAPSPGRCTQPGCVGLIEDGYCNVCGAAASETTAHADSASARLSTMSSRTGSSRLASAPIGSLRTGTKGFTARTRKINTDSARTRAARLGAGLTTVPPVPAVDPSTLVMANPEIPETKRFCGNCGAEVGRGRAGSPGRVEGYCHKCGTAFSFAAKLKRGDLVAGQYEVVGALAHGGLGWIYLARDKNVSDRYVVLKGLLNSGDAEAYAAAVAERQFLAEVHHPLIVEIFNFVQHDGAGYIVMEYVGGESLKEILRDRMAAKNGHYDPLPLDRAIAYILEILPAFSYLHANKLIYCDFKPDNVIQVEDRLKLIDLGGVRRRDDQNSAIYGTVGYQGPEVAELGPSEAGDLYTIGRTLAILAFDFRGYQATYVDRLPSPDEVALFKEHDSFYRLLLKTTATNPDDRFQSADELREQLLGVLREVVTQSKPVGMQASTSSPLFETPGLTATMLSWASLPELKPDPTDNMTRWLSTVSVGDPAALLGVLAKAPEQTIEVRLAACRAALGAGDQAKVAGLIDAILADDAWEWRALWMQGLGAVARGDWVAAVAAFNATYGQVPGELAPKLALAMACEGAGQTDTAEELYQVCARVDVNYIAPAAFGLARIRGARGDLTGALQGLDLIPETSRSYVDARRQRAAMLVDQARGLDDLAAAVDSVSAVTIEPLEREQLVARVLERALGLVARAEAPGVRVAGTPATRAALRDALSGVYRQLAGLADTKAERIRFVDSANRVRNRSLV